MTTQRIYLSRRNLMTLLSKLDRVRSGEFSHCTIIKNDTDNEEYPQTIESVMVTAVENDKYYKDRDPGEVLTVDDPN